jgi:hypothetical protein
MTARTLHVVSDREGFVGAFSTEAGARNFVAKHPLIPLLIARFAVPADVADGASVWVVPLKESGYVAHATTSHADAIRVCSGLAALDLTFSDAAEYLEQVVGHVREAALARLEMTGRVLAEVAGMAPPAEPTVVTLETPNVDVFGAPAAELSGAPPAEPAAPSGTCADGTAEVSIPPA